MFCYNDKCHSEWFVSIDLRKLFLQKYHSPSSTIQGIQKRMVQFKKFKKFISHLSRAQCTLSAVTTVQVSCALPAVCSSCLLQGRGASFQDGVIARKGFLCAPFWGVQICDYMQHEFCAWFRTHAAL
jgi:hypothetical protein